MTTPTFATGVAKQVAIALETDEGVNPVTGGQLLRRVSCDLSLNKDTYQSQEITASQQLIDARHGVHRPAGTFSGQLSPGSFNAFWQGILRSTFAAQSPIGPHDLALDTSAGTLTLTGGGFAAAGLKKEDVFYITGAASPNTALNNFNMRANGVTDTVITTRDLPMGLTTGTLSGVTINIPGKKIFMPSTGQQYDSYTIEQYYSDTDESEAFLGCKFGQTSVSLPSTGLVTFNVQITGIDMVATSGTGRQLTSPAAQSTTTSLAAVNGVISVNNVDYGIIQNMSLNISPMIQADPVIGSNKVPHIFQGYLTVTGSMSVLFTDYTLADLFLNETEFSASIVLATGQTIQGGFMRFTLPRVKFMGNQKSDGPMALVQSFNFTALQNETDTFFDETTIVLQDTNA